MSIVRLLNTRPPKKGSAYDNGWLHPFEEILISKIHALRMEVSRCDEQYQVSLTLIHPLGETRYTVTDQWLIDASRKHGMLIYIRAMHCSKGGRPERLLVEIIFTRPVLYLFPVELA